MQAIDNDGDGDADHGRGPGDDLRDGLRDMFTMIRLLKRYAAAESPTGPAGTMGLLGELAHGCEGTDSGHLAAIAERLALDASTISRSVSTLVERGHVERRPDPSDRRANLLTVTPAGRAALAELYALYDGVFAAALADWSDEDTAVFAAGLRRFGRAVTAHLTGPPAPEQHHPNRSDRPQEDAR